MAHQLLDIL